MLTTPFTTKLPVHTINIGAQLDIQTLQVHVINQME